MTGRARRPIEENTNVLAGMRCPECGALGPFSISVKCWVSVEDDGWDPHSYEGVEWNDGSECVCMSCGQSARVRDFRKAGAER